MLPHQREEFRQVHLAGSLRDVAGVASLQAARLAEHRRKHLPQLRRVQCPAAGIIPLGDLTQRVRGRKPDRRAGRLSSERQDCSDWKTACSSQKPRSSRLAAATAVVTSMAAATSSRQSLLVVLRPMIVSFLDRASFATACQRPPRCVIEPPHSWRVAMGT